MVDSQYITSCRLYYRDLEVCRIWQNLVDNNNNMATKDELFPFPGGKARSMVWKYFGFYKVNEGPPTKENLEMNKVICKICGKGYCNNGIIFVRIPDVSYTS